MALSQRSDKEREGHTRSGHTSFNRNDDDDAQDHLMRENIECNFTTRFEIARDSLQQRSGQRKVRKDELGRLARRIREEMKRKFVAGSRKHF